MANMGIPVSHEKILVSFRAFLRKKLSIMENYYIITVPSTGQNYLSKQANGPQLPWGKDGDLRILPAADGNVRCHFNCLEWFKGWDSTNGKWMICDNRCHQPK